MKFIVYLIRYFSNIETSFIQYGNKTFVINFDQIANDLIVEIFHSCPFYAFPLIFFLFLSQNEFCNMKKSIKGH